MGLGVNFPALTAKLKDFDLRMKQSSSPEESRSILKEMYEEMRTFATALRVHVSNPQTHPAEAMIYRHVLSIYDGLLVPVFLRAEKPDADREGLVLVIVDTRDSWDASGTTGVPGNGTVH
jgi:hypothetical protein